MSCRLIFPSLSLGSAQRARRCSFNLKTPPSSRRIQCSPQRRHVNLIVLKSSLTQKLKPRPASFHVFSKAFASSCCRQKCRRILRIMLQHCGLNSCISTPARGACLQIRGSLSAKKWPSGSIPLLHARAFRTFLGSDALRRSVRMESNNSCS